jgi:hypothetical protein
MLGRSGFVVTLMAVVVISLVVLMVTDNHPFPGCRTDLPDHGAAEVYPPRSWRVYPFVLAQITCCGGESWRDRTRCSTAQKQLEPTGGLGTFVMPRAAARVQQQGRICRETASHSSFATE